MKFTNRAGIPLPLIMWLLYDDYDYNDDPSYFSATTLMKPTRQTVLSRQYQSQIQEIDVEDLIPSALGRSIHTAIETSWLKGSIKKLSKIEGIDADLLDKIVINPDPKQIQGKDDLIPVYMEQRVTKEMFGYKIGGKYDLIADGILHDYKSTSAYTWVYDTNAHDYALQGSLYSLLEPGKIQENYIRICFIFTDWQKHMAASNPDYPQSRIAYRDYPLYSKEWTEDWIRNKLEDIEVNLKLPQHQMIECSEDELWFPTPKFKYYKDPTKTTGRSTRTFETLIEAQNYKTSKGGEGIVITESGQPKRCQYCPVFDICTQKDRYYHD